MFMTKTAIQSGF